MDHTTDKTNWDVERFADRVKNARVTGNPASEDVRVAKFFDIPNFGAISDPATFVDRHGRIMAWYLPGLLSPNLVVSNIPTFSIFVC